MFFGWEGPEREWGWGGRLFEFEFEGVGGGVGWALIRGWALIQFFCLRDGRLFEVGANSRLGAYSNKYGIFIYLFIHSFIYLYFCALPYVCKPLSKFLTAVG